ncbi:rhomboid family intramembrane serine protease [Flaviflexus ciconiae]|uniref:Rhomboid family intramembrane serine protease n=1 Tax=Flaviflexus ciconiae TaxID=2496867 RepID=A0A3Q9G2N2_9ACTO|nr:rhomboid family intramembrane serine protease [Flaviflexus ciconiae]AZQ77552.1 rhomboid family intramembrane serine protease [Flaviflexus ciconiae]
MSEYPDPVPAGPPPDPDRRRRLKRPTPYVTIGIIVLCIGVYGGGRLWSELESTLIFAPWLGEDQPYRFLGSAFLHADFWHLIFNMYALWLVGQAIEPVFGWWRFTCLYVLSAIAGNVAVLAFADPTGASWATFVVGASGAVFGLFGALFALSKGLSRDTTPLLVLLGINLILGFVVDGISWQSHVGGLLAGLLIGYLYTKSRRTWANVLATVLIALVLAGITFYIYAT